MRYRISISIFMLLVGHSNAYAVESENNPDPEPYNIELNHPVPTTDQEIIATINRAKCFSLDDLHIERKERGDEIHIDIRLRMLGLPSEQRCMDNPDSVIDVPLGKLEAGVNRIFYTLLLGGRTVISVANKPFTVVESGQNIPDNLNAFHEIPAQNSTQSGISMISGWACNANKVEISIDGDEKLRIPYGGSRGDTKEVCANDGLNGYGMVVAWGLLSVGEHRMQTFVDDVEIANVQFSVVKVDDDFVMGEGFGCTVPDFPNPGQQVRVGWKDALQNFTVISNPEPMQ
jgi:hypothetical protein